jgi:hypothetical protein
VEARAAKRAATRPTQRSSVSRPVRKISCLATYDRQVARDERGDGGHQREREEFRKFVERRVVEHVRVAVIEAHQLADRHDHDYGHEHRPVDLWSVREAGRRDQGEDRRENVAGAEQAAERRVAFNRDRGGREWLGEVVARLKQEELGGKVVEFVGLQSVRDLDGAVQIRL